jgi:ribosomal protein S18 acetylase RimI-like enzyme
MNKEIEIQKLQPADVEAIADLHYHTFKGFFLTSLGKSFLKQFYLGIINHKDGIGLGAFSNGELIGFAVGANTNSGFYKSLIRQKGFKLAIAAFANLILNPLKIKRLASSFLSNNISIYKEIAVLLSICVSNQLESKGVGKKLLSAFESDLKENRHTELILTTDALNNEYVNLFYVRNNYIKVQTFLQGKREMNLYHKKI